jgi:acetyltransferase-like isoleucine patch superfamily enzyme
MDALDDKTEFNLMIQGKPYLASDPYIGRVAAAQRAKLRAINAELDVAKRQALCHDFFTVTDEGEDGKWEMGFVSPFFCEYVRTKVRVWRNTHHAHLLGVQYPHRKRHIFQRGVCHSRRLSRCVQSYCYELFVISFLGKVHIGSRTLFGPNVQIYTAEHPLRPEDRNGTKGRESARPIRIGNDCWIGGAAIILPGVTIGDGVTVGAGSVVTRDVPARSVVVGNPARVVKVIP